MAQADDPIGDSAVSEQPAPYAPFPDFEDWLQEPFDATTVESFAALLESDKESLPDSAFGDSVAIATRWAAVNTGAIEGLYEVDRGFTYSVAASAAAWATIHNLKGAEAAASIEDQLSAYDFVLDAVTGARPVTEAWIRDLHSLVCASQATYSVITSVGVQQHTLSKGKYKVHANSPYNYRTRTVHSYASPTDTPAEMARMIEQFRTPGFESAHPVLQAAYAHYAFVCIHPFPDGNGRVSRALASMFLYRTPGVPLVIFADQKGDYIDSLERADSGDASYFVRFVAERVIDTIEMVRAQVDSARLPDIATQLADLAPILTGKEGLTHVETDAVANRLVDLVASSLKDQIATAGLSSGISARIQQAQLGDLAGMPAGYRSIPEGQSTVILNASSAAPARGQEQRMYSVAVARPNTAGADFVVYSTARVILEVQLREMHPTISQALIFRASAQASRELREIVAGVAVQAANSLRAQGYVE